MTKLQSSKTVYSNLRISFIKMLIQLWILYNLRVKPFEWTSMEGWRGSGSHHFVVLKYEEKKQNWQFHYSKHMQVFLMGVNTVTNKQLTPFSLKSKKCQMLAGVTVVFCPVWKGQVLYLSLITFVPQFVPSELLEGAVSQLTIVVARVSPSRENCLHHRHTLKVSLRPQHMFAILLRSASRSITKVASSGPEEAKLWKLKKHSRTAAANITESVGFT